MTQKEVLEIVTESKLWGSLSQKQKQEAINYALEMIRASEPEDNGMHTE